MKISNNLIQILKISVQTICLVLIFLGCNLTRKTQSQKDYEARQKKIEQLREVRKSFPCDTVNNFVEIGIPEKWNTGVFVKGDSVFIHDTILIPKKITSVVIDSALIHELRLDGMQKDHIIELGEEQKASMADEIQKLNADKTKMTAQIDELKTYKRVIYWGGSILALLGAFFVFKSPILSLIKRIL